jgi:glycosyltransferase involved in cell wall biosynthesis
MMIAWILKIRELPKVDTIILGSDPQFAALLFPVLRFLKKRTLLVQWCYDLYPEAIIAEGTNAFTSLLVRLASSMMRQAYHYVDLMVDIGPCMRARLVSYNRHFNFATLVPWALVEPETIQQPDVGTRAALFNDASLTLLYSGNLGKAHDFSVFLNLARQLRKQDPKIVFCFACRGNRYSELIEAVTPEDINIRFAPFADSQELGKRLNAADIHLLSLRPGWEGIVVPSKFFGSLAAGRPVIYAGPEGSAIGEWIRKYNIGLVLNENNIEEIIKQLLELRNNSEKLAIWQENAFKTYHKYFSKKIVVDRWDELLREYLSKANRANA